MARSEKRTPKRKPRGSRPLGTGAGGPRGDEFRDRLRLLIQDRAPSNRAFARHCGIPAARLSEWLAGEQLPGLPHLRRLADRTGVSLDWLLGGVGGESPIYVGQHQSNEDLERDLAIYVRREIHRLESEGAFDTGNGHSYRLGLQAWHVDGHALLAGLVRDEVRRVKNWIQWEERTDALDHVGKDILEGLRGIVPHLPPDDEELGATVYQLGRAAAQARDLRSALGVVDRPSSFRGYKSRSLSHPVVGPKVALEICEHELAGEGQEPPIPLSKRAPARKKRTRLTTR